MLTTKAGGQLGVVVVLVVRIRTRWVIHIPISAHCSTDGNILQGTWVYPSPVELYMGVKSYVTPSVALCGNVGSVGSIRQPKQTTTWKLVHINLVLDLSN